MPVFLHASEQAFRQGAEADLETKVGVPEKGVGGDVDVSGAIVA